MKSIKEWLYSLFSARKGSISSKRVIGVIGWLCILFVLVYCCVTKTEAPNMIDTVIFACTGLLGVDSVTDIWKKNGE